MLEHAKLSDRLNFSMHSFVRQQWGSDLSRERWQPQIDAARKTYQSIEIASVARGVRRAARRTISPTRLEAVANEVGAMGLTVTPIVNVVPNRAGYRAKLEYAKANEPFDVSCVIARDDDGKLFLEASRAHDDDTIGELLGIPACCRAFFKEIWHRQKMIDTTWPMARTSSFATNNEVIVSAEPETNVLLRWLGVRMVPHLPCSFDCRKSIRLARRLAQVAIQEGQGAGVAGAWEMLSWPMEWSSLHGIAEVRTPVFKIAFDTDPTGRLHRVQLRGIQYPEDAERGLRFPYLNANAPKRSRQLKGPQIPLQDANHANNSEPGTGTHSPVDYASIAWEKEHEENGFANTSAMLFAHLELLNSLDPIIDGVEGTIVDLGCGTGELLRCLGAGKTNVTLVGVDSDERKIARATAKLGQVARLYTGDYLNEKGAWLDDDHALVIGTMALLQSKQRMEACMRVISRAQIAVFYYYRGYKGDVVECVNRLKVNVASMAGKTLTRLSEQILVVHDKDIAVPYLHSFRHDI